MNWDSGLGFNALAPGQEARAHAAGADRHRVGAVAAARARSWGRWAKYMLDRGFEFYDRTAIRDGGIADPLFFNVHAVPQDVGQRAAGRRAHAGQRRPRGRGRARPQAALARRRRCTPTTRTSAAWPSRRPRTTPRSSRSTSARSRTAGSTWRGCSTAARRSPATIGGTPPASVRRDRARRQRPPRAGLAGRPLARSTAASRRCG